MRRTKVAKTAILEATAPEPNGQPEPAPDPQPRSVAEMPEAVHFIQAEQLALDGYGRRYRMEKEQFPQKLQEMARRLELDLKHLEGQLVGAVNLLLQMRKLELEKYEINVGDPPEMRVTVRLKAPPVPMPKEPLVDTIPDEVIQDVLP